MIVDDGSINTLRIRIDAKPFVRGSDENLSAFVARWLGVAWNFGRNHPDHHGVLILMQPLDYTLHIWSDQAIMN